METQHEDFRTKLERKKKSDHPFRSKLLHNVPIGLKYLSLFLISVVLFLGATMIVYLQLSSVKKDVLTIIDNSEMTNSLTELSMLIEKRQSTITSYAVSKNEQHIAEFEKTNEQIDEMFQQLDSVFIGTENEADYVSIKENAASVSNILHHSLIPKVETGENVTSTLLEIDAQKGALVNLLSELIANYASQQGSLFDSVEKNMNQSITFLLIINIFSILLGLVILIVISRFISNNLKRVVEVTAKIADGDLTVEPLPFTGKDEIGQLSCAVNTLHQNMRNIIKNVFDVSKNLSASSEWLMLASREVKEGSRQMVTTMDELASGAEAQASSASDLAEKMNRFVGSVDRSVNYPPLTTLAGCLKWGLLG